MPARANLRVLPYHYYILDYYIYIYIYDYYDDYFYDDDDNDDDDDEYSMILYVYMLVSYFGQLKWAQPCQPSYMTADMATQLETLTHEASHHEILGKGLGIGLR